jgi:hypothetical protein
MEKLFFAMGYVFVGKQNIMEAPKNGLRYTTMSSS